MNTLLESLSQHQPEITLALVVLTLALTVTTIQLFRKLRKMSYRWKELFEGTRGENIERLLYDHLRERMQLQEQIDVLKTQVNVLEGKMLNSKRHLGLVKYDAFNEVGGNQSFALALYDDEGHGAIITSQVGRSDCRVYAKPLLSGRSERSLSQEEQRAIQEAKEVGPKSIVSP